MNMRINAAQIEQLVARGQVNKRERNGSTPLSQFAHAFWHLSDKAEIVRLIGVLLDAGADPNLSKVPPACLAIGLGTLRGEIFGPEEGSHDDLKALLSRLKQAGADLDAFEPRGLYNPLIMAAYLGDVRLFDDLLELGTNPNITNRDGSTALMYAAGDVDLLDSSTAGISCAWCRRGDPLEVTRRLLALGADPATINKRRRTALRIAASKNNFDIAAELAGALAARQRLTHDDVRLFASSAWQAQVEALPTHTAQPRAARPTATAGVAQQQSWAKVQKKHDASTWYGKGSIEAKAFTGAILEYILASDLATRLYGTHEGWMPPHSLQLSKTKSFFTLSGAVEFGWAYDESAGNDSFRVSYARLENCDGPLGYNWFRKEEKCFPFIDRQAPDKAEVVAAIEDFCQRYFG
ncbi:ankyrin repeat domain-containing protein [Pseudomonas sp. ZM23]|uniref:Ankyrin repeat domain-containing protein n=1 Tax=Pseudomonas triclosanedens TaxID=2961893 RepID=A0ABY6ZSC7_9PSED|nr:ankyrin repeat domain-containing protein [Pseudomonas triclosanedens]MCP8467274.1 ankyrin repeat domain-containing protein [Pseudomonas triclosanedens]MCP8472601.1 ankyrin repeat domain-containing protein [Pseudomonas triclosanedens]MCP8478662.1 ankyrin repeat domain-containing protein [Pseudomonas triclosanedens]WAI47837.1 ankyrin repeat domain-containing protein [Pseudomonas triclosanedens]